MKFLTPLGPRVLGNPSPHMLSVWEKWKYKWRSCQSLLILPRWILCGYQMMLYNAGVLARRILCCLHHPFILLVSRHCQCTKFNIAWYASEEYSASPTLPLPSPLVSCAGHCHWEPTMANLCSFDILCHLCVWYAATSLCLICCTIFGCSSTVPCVRALCWNTFVLHPGFCSGLWYAETPTTMPCTLLHCDNTMPCTLLHNSASFFGSVVRVPWDAPCDSGMANLCT